MIGYEPLSISEKRRMGHLMRALRSAVLVGNQAPIVGAMWQRMEQPRPGDFVVEMSTLPSLLRGDPLVPLTDVEVQRWDGQFTRYLRSEERFTPDEDGEDGFTELVHVCENPDGTEFVWTNAELMMAPITGEFLRSTAHTP